MTSQDILEDKISGLINHLDRFNHKDIKSTFNIMVEGDSTRVDTIVDDVFQNANLEKQVRIKEIERFSRIPGYPKPSMRIK